MLYLSFKEVGEPVQPRTGPSRSGRLPRLTQPPSRLGGPVRVWEGKRLSLDSDSVEAQRGMISAHLHLLCPSEQDPNRVEGHSADSFQS